MHKPLVIEHNYLGYLRLALEEHALRYTNGKNESVIPISSVRSFTIKDARSAMRPGVITINIGSANNGYIGMGHFAVGFGNELTMVFNKEYTAIAYKMRDYIMNYSSHGVAPPASAADEIRKFKALCDDGIITSEEFEAKKASLLRGEYHGTEEEDIRQNR